MLTPPPPISPVFQDNVDVLIQDLLKNQKGVNFTNPAALLNRQKQDEATLFEILEKIKLLGTGVGVSDGDKGDITVSSGGTIWTIDTGLIPTISDIRTSISLTTIGGTGLSTYNNITGVLNIPQYLGGTGVLNTMPYWTGTNALSSTANLYWDDVNVRLGLGISTPEVGIHVKGSIGGGNKGILVEYTGGKYATLVAGTSGAGFGIVNTGYFAVGGISSYYDSPNNNFYLDGATGNVIFSNTVAGTLSVVPSAMIDMRSTTKGFLPPRMTQVQRNAIGSPATGLIAYQTSAAENLYLKKSTAWKRILTEDDSVTSTIGTNSNVLIDCGSFLAPNENVLIDCGSFVTILP